MFLIQELLGSGSCVPDSGAEELGVCSIFRDWRAGLKNGAAAPYSWAEELDGRARSEDMAESARMK